MAETGSDESLVRIRVNRLVLSNFSIKKCYCGIAADSNNHYRGMIAHLTDVTAVIPLSSALWSVPNTVVPALCATYDLTAQGTWTARLRCILNEALLYLTFVYRLC